MIKNDKYECKKKKNIQYNVKIAQIGYFKECVYCKNSKLEICTNIEACLV